MTDNNETDYTDAESNFTEEFYRELEWTEAQIEEDEKIEHPAARPYLWLENFENEYDMSRPEVAAVDYIRDYFHPEWQY